MKIFWATNQSYISFSFISALGRSSENHNFFNLCQVTGRGSDTWYGTVLPGGSRGSPGWSETCRKRSPRLSPPTQNHLGPENGRKKVIQRFTRFHQGWEAEGWPAAAVLPQRSWLHRWNWTGRWRRKRWRRMEASVCSQTWCCARRSSGSRSGRSSWWLQEREDQKRWTINNANFWFRQFQTKPQKRNWKVKKQLFLFQIWFFISF